MFAIFLLFALLLLGAILILGFLAAKKQIKTDVTIEQPKKAGVVVLSSLQSGATVKEISDIADEIQKMEFKSDASTRWLYQLKHFTGINEFINYLMEKYGYDNPKVTSYLPVLANFSGGAPKYIVAVVLDKVVEDTTYKLGLIITARRINLDQLKDTSKVLDASLEDTLDGSKEIWVTSSDPIVAMIPELPEIDGERVLRSPVKYKEIEEAIIETSFQTKDAAFRAVIRELTYDMDDGFGADVTEVKEGPQPDLLKNKYQDVKVLYGDIVKILPTHMDVINVANAVIQSGRSLVLTDMDNITDGGTGKTKFIQWLSKSLAMNPLNYVVFAKGLPGGYDRTFQQYISNTVRRLEREALSPDKNPTDEKRKLIVFIDEAKSIFTGDVADFMAIMENTQFVDICFVLLTNHLPSGLPKPFRRSGRVITMEFGALKEACLLPLLGSLQKEYRDSKMYVFNTETAKRLVDKGYATLNDIYETIEPVAFSNREMENLLSSVVDLPEDDDDEDKGLVAVQKI